MIGRKTPTISEEDTVVVPKGFDDFELRLGDIMRGERATMGKSLLDVQRELRIKASYIAAIENTDPSAFDTPGFIAGYVRSYARYLGMDPEAAFQTFCAESGFSVAHGMSARASVVKKAPDDRPARSSGNRDPFASSRGTFAPVRESLLSQIDPRAVASSLVLLSLIGGIGFGGWSVLKQVQRVQVAPVEHTPVVLSDLDPLKPSRPAEESAAPAAPSADALDRLYRPQALDVPVLVARDAPISTLDPRSVGTFTQPGLPNVQRTELAYGTPSLLPDPLPAPVTPQVVENAAPVLAVVAVRPAWVRVSANDGTVLYEGIMEGGARFEVPATEEPPVLRAGESGSVYLAVNETHFGPVGARGTVTSGTVLSIDAVRQAFAVASLDADGDLSQLVAKRVAEAEAVMPADE
jgi:cytoskeletal protein RodZ